MPVIKKPRGKIKVVSRHRTPKGMIFLPDEIHEYFTIIERRECNCNGKRGKLLYKLYKTNKGLIPTTKAIII
jgi:hypothetical protein